MDMHYACIALVSFVMYFLCVLCGPVFFYHKVHEVLHEGHESDTRFIYADSHFKFY